MNGLTIEYRRGYWCVCHNGKAIMSLKSRDDARNSVPEAIIIEAGLELTERRIAQEL